MNFDDMILAYQILPIELWNTLYMVFAAALFSVLIGLPLGIVLTIVSKGHIAERPFLSTLLETSVNIVRSVPFAILMISLIPITRAIVGTSLGTTAAVVPLTIAAAPFIARLIESSLKSVDPHVIEAAVVMGSTKREIVTKVLLPEALPSIVSDITLTLINLVGYSAMAGMVGGGGLGQVAIQYGYNRFNSFIMCTTVILLIIIVQLIQWIGTNISAFILQRRGLKK